MSQEGNPKNQNVQSDQATLSNQAGQEHDTASAMPKANLQPTDATDRELGQDATNKQRASTRLDLFDNSDFHPGNVVKRLLWICFSGLFFQTWIPWPSKLKSTLLRGFGARIGKGLVIKPRVTIKYPWKLRIGDHVGLGRTFGLTTSQKSPSAVTSVFLKGLLLLCGNHNFKTPTFDLITRPITLEDGVWIGAKSASHRVSLVVPTVSSPRQCRDERPRSLDRLSRQSGHREKTSTDELMTAHNPNGMDRFPMNT